MVDHVTIRTQIVEEPPSNLVFAAQVAARQLVYLLPALYLSS